MNLEKNNTSDWVVTTNRFVGFIDIMGFKDMVSRNSHEKMYEMMKRVWAAVQGSEKHFAYRRDEYGNKETLITMTTYSDSIIIYSKDSSDICLDYFIGAISSLCDDLFEESIPHKGAVAYGQMTLDFARSIFFGQPLIDAYLLQEELAFYGVVAHSSIEYRRGFKNDDCVMLYQCPFKNGSANHFTIIPLTFTEIKTFEEDYKVLKMSVLGLGRRTSGHLRKYIDSTVSYLDHIRNKVIKSRSL